MEKIRLLLLKIPQKKIKQKIKETVKNKAMTIITTNETKDYEQIANDNKHLVEEGETIHIKSYYGQRVYYKVDNKMELKLK